MSSDVPARELQELIHGGHAEECLRRAAELLAHSERTNDDPQASAQLLGLIAVAHQYIGRSRDSLIALYRGLSIASSIGDLAMVGWMSSLAAVDHARLGDSVEALRMLAASQDAVRDLDDLTCTRVWNNHAVTHHHFSQWDQALDANDRAMEHARRLDEPYPLLHATSNRVLYLLMQARELLKTDPEAAARDAHAALDLATATEKEALAHGWGHVVGVMYREVGPLLCAMGEHDRARDLLRRCVDSANEVGRAREVGAVLIRSAVVERLDGIPGASLHLLHRARAVVEEFDDAELRIELQLELSNVHAAMGDHASALEAFRLYHELHSARLADLHQAKAQVLAARLGADRARTLSELHKARADELESSIASLTDEARRLSHAAVTDPLTGVGNRRLFDNRIATLMDDAADTSLMFIDLDHFKVVNDVLGHSVGDEVLVRMGQLLREALRPQDLVCRYGGEEFLVALPATDAVEAEKIAQRLRATVASYPWGEIEGGLTVTCSVGVTTGRGLPLQEMLFEADQALYAAKSLGRDRVCVATASRPFPVPHGLRAPSTAV